LQKIPVEKAHEEVPAPAAASVQPQLWGADGGAQDANAYLSRPQPHSHRLTLSSAPNQVDCAPSVPCSLTGPSGTGTGDPAWLAFGKDNANTSAAWAWALMCSAHHMVCSNSGVLSQGVTITDTAPVTLSVRDYGALCDGSTPDDAAWLAWEAAGKATIVGSFSRNVLMQGCGSGVSVVTTTGLNFTWLDNVANPPVGTGVVVDLTGTLISCAINGGTCVQGMGAQYGDFKGVHVTGSCTPGSIPKLGITMGRLRTDNSAAKMTWEDPRADGCYTLSSRYVLASESTTIYGSNLVNDYKSTPTTFASIMDGIGYWTANGSVTASDLSGNPILLPNTVATQSFSGFREYGSNISNNNTGTACAAVWQSATVQYEHHGYINSQCAQDVILYFVTGVSSQMQNNEWHSHMEACSAAGCNLAQNFLLTGNATSVQIPNFHFDDFKDFAYSSVFTIDPTSSLTSVAFIKADIGIGLFNCPANSYCVTPSSPMGTLTGTGTNGTNTVAFTDSTTIGATGTVSVTVSGGNVTAVAIVTQTGAQIGDTLAFTIPGGSGTAIIGTMSSPVLVLDQTGVTAGDYANWSGFVSVPNTNNWNNPVGQSGGIFTVNGGFAFLGGLGSVSVSNLTTLTTGFMKFGSRQALTAPANFVLQLDTADQAIPDTSVTVQAQNASGSSGNKAGQVIVWQCGIGTGNATGCTQTFNTSHATTSGTTLQTENTQLVLGDQTQTIGNSSSTTVQQGTVNLNAVVNGGTATKYVCTDSSGHMVVQAGAC
jgi:hypothetical protein